MNSSRGDSSRDRRCRKWIWNWSCYLEAAVQSQLYDAVLKRRSDLCVYVVCVGWSELLNRFSCLSWQRSARPLRCWTATGTASSPNRNWEWPCGLWGTCPVRWSSPSSCRDWTWTVSHCAAPPWCYVLTGCSHLCSNGPFQWKVYVNSFRSATLALTGHYTSF